MPKNITIETIHKHYKRAGRFSNKWRTEAKTDLEFCLGKQWEDKVKNEIEKQGRPALTLNIIQPNIRMIVGYQRESRSSIKAFPEGGEDELASEIVTRLLKNVIKNSKAENVISEAFETALTARGKGFIEPYIDYTYDLLNGKLQFNVLDGWQIRLDPNSIKYDMSDARYIIKEKKLTKDEILELHPTKKTEIDRGTETPMRLDDGSTDSENILESGEDMPDTEEMDNEFEDEEDKNSHKYLEYLYKKYITQYLAIDKDKSIAQLFDNKEDAKMHIIGPERKRLNKNQKIIERRMPQIWVVASVGMEILDDQPAESFPNWRGYPIIPLFAWYSAVGKRALKKEHLAYQGVASSLRDPQMEKNKRRSQSLAIVNSITNRGWLSEENAWVDKNLVKRQGASSGVTLEYKAGKPPPKELNPGQIPQSHVYFEEKSEEDIKMISGINADMLSVEDKTTSGRAIALRQQQGLRILKPLFDNLVWTQEILGKYIVSQLPELYTVDKALRVLGGEFLDKNFRKNETDLPEMVQGAAAQFVEELLNNKELCDYDISIGEGLESPTERYAQYSVMLELAKEGIPIPPQVLIEYADIPESAKKEITIAVQEAQNAPPPEPAAGPKKKPPKKKE